MRSDRGKESSEKGGTALPLAEDFYTIQGEGYQTGTAAYFIRLAGCDVGCPWCDAKYTWNIRRYPVSAVEKVIGRAAASGAPCAVITGGEPLMHPLVPLTEGLKANGLPGIPRNFGNASAARGIRLDMPLPETAGPSAGGGLPSSR